MDVYMMNKNEQPIDVPEEVYSISDEYNRTCKIYGLYPEGVAKKCLPPQFAKYFVEIDYDYEFIEMLDRIYYAAVIKVPGLATIRCFFSFICGCVYGYIADTDEYVLEDVSSDAPSPNFCRNTQDVIKEARHIYMTRFGKYT